MGLPDVVLFQKIRQKTLIYLNTKIRVLDVSSLQSELMGVLTSVGKIKKIRISKKILLPKNLSAKVIEEVDASQPEN